MTDRLTEIKARLKPYRSFPGVYADLEYVLGEIERLTNVAGTYQKQYYDCAKERDGLRAGVGRLMAALEAIADHEYQRVCKDIARAFLEVGKP
jgi:hypothetical protein